MAKKSLKFSNRLSYTIIAIIALALVAVGVYASVGAGTTPDPGHNIQSIGAPSGCLVGQYLQYVNDQRCISGPCWICSNVTSGSESTWDVPSDVKITSSSHSADFGGYQGMYNWIQTAGCSGYHVCDASELTNYYQIHPSPSPPQSYYGWFNSGSLTNSLTSSAATVDCEGWTTASTLGMGLQWDGTKAVPRDCSVPGYHVMCCK
jgi:hypothetical protein